MKVFLCVFILATAIFALNLFNRRPVGAVIAFFSGGLAGTSGYFYFCERGKPAQAKREGVVRRK